MGLDRRIWIFIITTSFVVPVFFWLKASFLGETKPLLYYLTAIPFTFIVTFLITWVNMSMVKKFLLSHYKWSHDSKQITQRIIVEVILTSLVALLVVSILTFILLMIQPVAEGKIRTTYFNNALAGLLLNFGALTIIEGNFIFKQWKESLVSAEVLERENAEARYAALKNQVNPHFLFNSLNALSSLVDSDQDLAKKFINDFSKVYRYLLDMSEKSVVELERELDFLKSYAFLHKIRHGDHLEVIVDIDDDKMHLLVPVLSIQILVENAIKHNEISERHPLKIYIFEDAGMLIVKNKIKPRSGKEHSSGIGLENLKARYKYLCQKEPGFGVIGDAFQAEIPLIEDE